MFCLKKKNSQSKVKVLGGVLFEGKTGPFEVNKGHGQQVLIKTGEKQMSTEKLQRQFLNFLFFIFLPCQSIYSNSRRLRSPEYGCHLKTNSRMTKLHKRKAFLTRLLTKEPEERGNCLQLHRNARSLHHLDRMDLISTLAPLCGAPGASAVGPFHLGASLDMG